MARATKEETKVIEMENKIEKMTQFLNSWLTIKLNASTSKSWRTSITLPSSAAAWK